MHTSQSLPSAAKFLVSVQYSAEQQRGVTVGTSPSIYQLLLTYLQILVLVSCISLVAVVVLLSTITVSR